MWRNLRPRGIIWHPYYDRNHWSASFHLISPNESLHHSWPGNLRPLITKEKGHWMCILSFLSGGITASTGFRGMVVAVRWCLKTLLATR